MLSAHDNRIKFFLVGLRKSVAEPWGIAGQRSSGCSLTRTGTMFSDLNSAASTTTTGADSILSIQARKMFGAERVAAAPIAALVCRNDRRLKRLEVIMFSCLVECSPVLEVSALYRERGKMFCESPIQQQP